MNPADYGLPENYCVTSHTWTDANEPVLHGATSGTWHTNAKGEFAVLKPGPGKRRPDAEEPYREWLASRLARMLRVNVSIVELHEHAEGPSAVVYATRPRAYPYTHAMAMMPDAKAAFTNYSGIVVLDTLIGARDRSNNNLVYHDRSRSWYSIDYSHCFGIDGGSGPPAPCDHAHNPNPNYPDDLRAALDDPAPISDALMLAELITDKEIEDLCTEPPSMFYQRDRRLIVEYLTFRKNNIRAKVNDWLALVGRPPIIKGT